MPPQIAATPSSMSRSGSIKVAPLGASTERSTLSRSITRTVGMITPATQRPASLPADSPGCQSLGQSWGSGRSGRLAAREAPEPAQGAIDVDPKRQRLTLHHPEAGGRCQLRGQGLRGGVVGQHAGDVHERVAMLRVFPIEQPQPRSLQQIALRQIPMDDAARALIALERRTALLEPRERLEGR